MHHIYISLQLFSCSPPLIHKSFRHRLFMFMPQQLSHAHYDVVINIFSVFTAVQLGRAQFYRSTVHKRPFKHQKPIFDVYKDIYYLCSDFAMDFLHFCRPQRRTAVYRPEGGYPVHLSRPPFTAVRPENGEPSQPVQKHQKPFIYVCQH